MICDLARPHREVSPSPDKSASTTNHIQYDPTQSPILQKKHQRKQASQQLAMDTVTSQETIIVKSWLRWITTRPTSFCTYHGGWLNQCVEGRPPGHSAIASGPIRSQIPCLPKHQAEPPRSRRVRCMAAPGVTSHSGYDQPKGRAKNRWIYQLLRFFFNVCIVYQHYWWSKVFAFLQHSISGWWAGIPWWHGRDEPMYLVT